MRANQPVLVEILNHHKIQKTLKEIPGKILRKRQRVKRLNHTRKSPNQILTRIKSEPSSKVQMEIQDGNSSLVSSLVLHPGTTYSNIKNLPRK